MNKTFPAPSISLSGKAESRLGDSLLSAAGRFFLFEVKPTATQFRSEWKILENEDGSFRHNKIAFKKVKSISHKFIPTSGAQLTNSEVDDALRSLLGHQIIYWDSILDSLAIRPYLTTTLSGYVKDLDADPLKPAIEEKDRSLKFALPRINKLFTFAFTGAANAIRILNFQPCETGSASGIYTKQLGIVLNIEKKSNERAWIPLGLPAQEFNNYLKLLCKGAVDGNEPINAIVLSDQGFMHALSNTSEIVNFMEILQERIDNKALPSNLDLATNFPKLTPKSIPVNLSDSTKQLTSIIEFADRSVGIDLNRDLS
ncbi:hypothetical protein [Xanthomonas hortorum]|uniref:Uncharacterized protein n=1 Tax=Xanthomonas hortorum pv. hederae TaxID=453603 RepID=A0A9X4H861_9XANT|nr:hypothetical protein [Xanthomonas hortorum]MDC8640855.1 hypothetical protein [Xanthomonas hortorum pv. hederae]